MTCPRCGLPDSYHGEGDGIGSCDCPRCDCCGAGPDECRCRHDWDEISHLYDDEPETDGLCNDPDCDHLRLRLERSKAKETATS